MPNYVKTIEGLYDEKCEAITMDINRRGLCISHKWVNASLHWSKWIEEGVQAWIDLSSPGEPTQRKWGQGYGPIRFCKKCKRINCIHNLQEPEIFCVGDELHHVSHSISFCIICHRRILTSSCGVYEPTKSAMELIDNTAKELNKNWNISAFGSAWFMEFPLKVSRLMKKSKSEAETYVHNAFLSGRI